MFSQSNLIRELVGRDVRDRYSGSWLGMAWSLLTPMILIAIYSTVFGAVFGARIPGMEQSHPGTFGFGVYLFSGLLPFTIFSEVLSRSPGLVWGNPNYVKKVVFPLEILPVVTVISSLVHSVLPFIVLLVAAYFVVGPLPATAALYPFAVLLMIPLLLGLGWAIAALGAYVRDLGQVITLAVTVFMFLSPIFVPVGKFPPWAQPLVRLNPVTVPIELCNAALFGTPAPGIETVLTYTVCSVAMCLIGWKIFAICRSGFADVV